MDEMAAIHSRILVTALRFSETIRKAMWRDIDPEALASILEAQDEGAELVLTTSLDGTPGLVVHLVPRDGEPSEVFRLAVDPSSKVLTRH